MTLLAAFLRALRDAGALAETADALVRERWAHDCTKRRLQQCETERRFMAAEIRELEDFVERMEPSVEVREQ